MKRLRKQIEFSPEEIDQLNKLEQQSLLGGYYGDTNTNDEKGCICDYINHPQVTNLNQAFYCACRCV